MKVRYFEDSFIGVQNHIGAAAFIKNNQRAMSCCTDQFNQVHLLEQSYCDTNGILKQYLSQIHGCDLNEAYISMQHPNNDLKTRFAYTSRLNNQPNDMAQEDKDNAQEDINELGAAGRYDQTHNLCQDNGEASKFTVKKKRSESRMITEEAANLLITSTSIDSNLKLLDLASTTNLQLQSLKSVRSSLKNLSVNFPGKC